MMKYVTDLLYPRRCPICDGILERKERTICTGCRPELQLIRGPVCLCCGTPIRKEEEEYCFDCRRRKHLFSVCRAPFLYKGKIKDSLMRFKYLGRAEYALFYGRVMTEYGKEQGLFCRVDLIVPVPVHRQRRIERGYNQAELLAVQIAACSGIPWDGTVIVRTRKTSALKTVSGNKRSRNLADAFAVPKGKEDLLAGKRVLLVDDIYTTGSTADAVSRKLLEAGAVSVAVVTLAVSPGYS